MLIDLNDEAVDGIVKSILIQDYKGLKKDTNRLKKIKNKAKYQLEDLQNNQEYLTAYEKLIEYYVGYHWKEEL